MLNDKTKTLCLIAAFALTASGCGGSGEDSGNIEIADPLTLSDDAVVTNEGNATAINTASTEVTDNTGISEGIATPVQPVSSVQMDKFVKNPLVAAIPAELNRGRSNTSSSNFIINPLMN